MVIVFCFEEAWDVCRETLVLLGIGLQHAPRSAYGSCEAPLPFAAFKRCQYGY